MPTSRRGKKGRGSAGDAPPPPAAAPAAAVPDPLAGLSEERRALAASKADAERRLAAGEDLPLEDLILCLPVYDPRVDAGSCRFDRAAAEHYIGFFHDCLTHIEGEWAGRPFLLGPWQKAIVANLFGWKRPDGFRRYRELFLEVPRKNGKTPLAAGIVLALLCVDDEPGAQIYSAASDREQAALLYRHAEGMVHQEPALASRVLPRVSGKCLEYVAAGSFYRALSAEARSKHGFNSHGVVVDELHTQKNGKLIEVLESSMGTRRQPLLVSITTADFARPSICNEKEAHADKVARGLVVDPEFLPVIYRADPKDPWDVEATWRKANPNYGVSIKPAELARAARLARLSPRARNTFLRLHLNVKTSADVAWLPDELWRPCGVPSMLERGIDAWIDELGLEGAECHGGLDLSAVRDLSAFVLYFPEEQVLLPTFWSPAERAEEREATEGVSYTAWASEGWLNLTPGRTVDHERIRKGIGELGERFRIRDICFDRWGASQLVRQLDDDGFELVKFGQGYASMSNPSKELERLVVEGVVRHGGHPVLAWNAANVMVEQDAAENIKPSKKKSTDRIDGIVAAVMALGGHLLADAEAPFKKGFKRL